MESFIPKDMSNSGGMCNFTSVLKVGEIYLKIIPYFYKFIFIYKVFHTIHMVRLPYKTSTYSLESGSSSSSSESVSTIWTVGEGCVGTFLPLWPHLSTFIPSPVNFSNSSRHLHSSALCPNFDSPLASQNYFSCLIENFIISPSPSFLISSFN
jgi:hypothetical protein